MQSNLCIKAKLASIRRNTTEEFLCYQCSVRFTVKYCMRMRNWVKECNRISEFQAGFREGYSTLDNVFVLMSLINDSLKNKRGNFFVFVDFKMAFDTVDRSVLWHKLQLRGSLSKCYRP